MYYPQDSHREVCLSPSCDHRCNTVPCKRTTPNLVNFLTVLPATFVTPLVSIIKLFSPKLSWPALSDRQLMSLFDLLNLNGKEIKQSDLIVVAESRNDYRKLFEKGEILIRR